MFIPGSAIFPPFVGKIAHLTFVLTHPSHNGEVVVVNITSKTDVSDHTVVINKTDYDLLDRPTSIAYDYMHFAVVEKMTESVRCGLLVRGVDLDPYVLSIVQRGACKSKRAPKAVRAYCCSLFCPCPRTDGDDWDGCPNCP